MLTEINSTKRHLPVELQGLPTIQAELAYTIAPGGPAPSLEGPVFDRHGNFYCCLTVPNNTIIKKVSPAGEITDFAHFTSGMQVGLCFHKDGRCFVADMLGCAVHILSAEGELLDTIPVSWEGRELHPDCMVFRNGDLYFTDLSGYYNHPIGGVYILRAADGYHTLDQYLTDLTAPDGITFAPDGKSLWISEVSSNSVLRYLLDPEGQPRLRQHTPVQAYRNEGCSNVDSHVMDENGCIYVGIMMGGRAVILDTDGVPLANIVVPGFEEGKLRYTPNLALSPDKKVGYLLASDDERAVVLSFPTFAPGQKLYAHE